MIPRALFSVAFLFLKESLSLFHPYMWALVGFMIFCVQNILCEFHCARAQGSNAPERVCIGKLTAPRTPQCLERIRAGAFAPC